MRQRKSGAPIPTIMIPGKIAEGWYRVEVFSLLRVEDRDGRMLGSVTLRLGDDVEAAARKILRESQSHHGAFHDPISYRGHVV